MTLRIGMIGTGALASLMAARLAEQADVVMLGSWPEQLDAIEAHGLTLVEADGRSQTLSLIATDEPLLLEPVDVALVLVKSYQTGTAVRRLRTLLNTDTLIVTLQNGLGNWDTLAQAYGAWRVVQGVTSLGATMVQPGVVRAAGDGPISLARMAANMFFEPFVACLRAAGFSVELVHDVQGLVWGKLAVNAAINPLTAVLHVRNGLLAEEEALCMIVSGGGALVLAELFGWFTAYAAMAAMMGIGVITVLLSREPARPDVAETSIAADPFGWIRSAVIAPLADFAQRPHWVAILLFIALYKYGDALIGVMANPFYLAIGFTKAEIGLVSKSYGVIMTISGGLIGGVIVARLGIMRALLICGVLQAASNLVFVAQAMAGANLSVFIVTMSVENLAGGMGTAAFVAYLSSLCNVAYTATQYALVSSFMAFTRTIFASGGGWLADQVDWTTYFLISTAAALPGLALLIWMMRAFPTNETAGMAPGRA